MDVSNQLSSANAHVNIFQRGQILPGRFSRYTIEDFLGEGSFGKVVQSKNLTTGEDVAIKVVKKEHAYRGMREVMQLEMINKLCPDRKNLLKFYEHFTHQNQFCMVFEKLDMSLWHFMVKRNFKPLEICEIRPIAQQLLVALKALKTINLVHADIKPDNIMLVCHESQPFKVKLIDFGLANGASNLWTSGIVQNLSYRAPEVLLGLPTLDQGVDMWTLGCVLAFLYLGEHLYGMDNEYETLRTIIHLHGKPSNEFLDAAYKTRRFFNLIQEGPENLWWLKTMSEYARDAREVPQFKAETFPDFISMDGLMLRQKGRNISHIYEDTLEFISILKRMFTVEPKSRITPEEALSHNFITMKHLPLTTDHRYTNIVKEKMSVCSWDEEDRISPGCPAKKNEASGIFSRDQKDTEMHLRLKLEQMKLSYNKLNLKYEADVRTLKEELNKEKQRHAQKEAEGGELIKTPRAEMDALHQQKTSQEQIFKLQTELQQVKLSYEEMSRKYEADVQTSRLEASKLLQELKKEKLKHAKKEVEDKQQQNTLKAEINALHQQKTSLEQTFNSTRERLQTELEQMKLSYEEMRRKYEADVQTSRLEASKLLQELKKEKLRHAKKEVEDKQQQKTLKAEINALHQQKTSLEKTFNSTRERLQTELEQMKLSYEEMRRKYEADVQMSKQEASKRLQELKKEKQRHAKKEVEDKKQINTLKAEMDALHQQKTSLEQTFNSTRESLQTELEQMKLSYEERSRKYEADVQMSKQEASNLQEELQKQMQIYAEKEVEDKEQINTLKAEMDALHQQKTSLEQTFNSTRESLQTELEQMKLSYEEMSRKYEADVQTSKQEASNLQEELQKKMQIYAEKEVEDKEQINTLKADVDALHQQKTSLEQTFNSTRESLQTELEQMKLSYEERSRKYEADVQMSKQEASNLQEELQKKTQMYAEKEVEDKEQINTLRTELDALHQQIEQQKTLKEKSFKQKVKNWGRNWKTKFHTSADKSGKDQE